MAQPTVAINAPSGNTPVPCSASGSAAPSAVGQTIAGLAYQIDNGPVNPISFTAQPAGVTVNWIFQLSAQDCPIVGMNYLFTVYAGESPGGNFNADSVNIVRQS